MTWSIEASFGFRINLGLGLDADVVEVVAAATSRDEVCPLAAEALRAAAVDVSSPRLLRESVGSAQKQSA